MHIIINDEIKCFPFQSVQEAKEEKKKLGKAGSNLIVAFIKPEYSNYNGFSYVLINCFDNPTKFYDKDGFVTYKPTVDCYGFVVG